MDKDHRHATKAPSVFTNTAFFHSTGYLRARHTVDSVHLERARMAAERLTTHSHPYISRSADKVRVDHVVLLDSTFLDLARSEAVLEVLKPVLGPNIELIENRHNHLTIYYAPYVDRLHRDVLHWSRSILTVLIYLSDCTEPNSATRVIPGSHLWPGVGNPNNGGTWLDQAPPYRALRDQAVPIPAEAGDAVLVHGQLYHSGAGATTEPRMVLTLAYRSVDELTEAAPHCRLVLGTRIHRGRGGARA